MLNPPPELWPQPCPMDVRPEPGKDTITPTRRAGRPEVVAGRRARCVFLPRYRSSCRLVAHRCFSDQRSGLRPQQWWPHAGRGTLGPCAHYL